MKLEASRNLGRLEYHHHHPPPLQRQNRQHGRNWMFFLFRPSFWVACISIIAYWDEQALHGEFVYDDDGSIRANPVVNGRAPWTDVFSRDFWGTPMSDIQSHKSFRPITTLSFRFNWLLVPTSVVTHNNNNNNTAEEFVPGQDRTLGTFSFHVINVILHGIVSGLVTEASLYVFPKYQEKSEDAIASIVTGLVFGLHPVHVEAVSNITSRGELIMSFFFLLAFISYASQLSNRKQPPNGLGSFLSIYIIPWICMTLSLFSKEQGASTLISLVVFDLLQNHFSLVQLVRSIFQWDPKALSFLRRTFVLAIETCLVCGWRYWLNGETSPDFIFDQNPAGFVLDRFTRVFSVSWVYCLYLRDAVYPQFLSVDWSGRSIALITELSDWRVLVVGALWIFTFLCLLSLVFGLPAKSSEQARFYRTSILMAFVAFLFCPFLLSSNILVTVGLMKADRVIYLPLMGFCLLEALLVRYVCSPWHGSAMRWRTWHYSPLAKLCHIVLVLQMLFYCRKVHERNMVWSDAVRLWTAAYQVNPKSYHTIYNCGYNLSLKGRYKEAEHVLRPIGHPDVDGATTTFVYAMVLQNLGRCEEAQPLLARALEVVEERKELGGPRNTKETLKRAESNLLVASGFCTQDIKERAKILLRAVNVDPTNSYAVEQAEALNDFIVQQRAMNDPNGILSGRVEKKKIF